MKEKYPSKNAQKYVERLKNEYNIDLYYCLKKWMKNPKEKKYVPEHIYPSDAFKDKYLPAFLPNNKGGEKYAYYEIFSQVWEEVFGINYEDSDLWDMLNEGVFDKEFEEEKTTAIDVVPLLNGMDLSELATLYDWYFNIPTQMVVFEALNDAVKDGKITKKICDTVMEYVKEVQDFCLEELETYNSIKWQDKWAKQIKKNN